MAGPFYASSDNAVYIFQYPYFKLKLFTKLLFCCCLGSKIQPHNKSLQLAFGAGIVCIDEQLCKKEQLKLNSTGEKS